LISDLQVCGYGEAAAICDGRGFICWPVMEEQSRWGWASRVAKVVVGW
jgi:hypothetical protein